MDKIFIVTHKNIKKINKKGYSYIQVNAKENSNLGFEYNDFNGDNISTKNKNYCELTALYWIWKNYKCDNNDIIGLCHYRRFFSTINNKYFFLSLNKAKKILNKYDIILPNKFKFSVTTRKYYSEYGCGKDKDLENVKKIIETKYPEYLNSFDEYCNQNSGSYCNMMICKKELFDEYCEWLFSILFELEKITDLSSYTPAEARIYGYISELLLNIFVSKNNLKVKYMKMVNIESGILYKLKRKWCKR